MLQELCMENILSQIDRLPPLMKDTIVEEVNKRERARIMDDAVGVVCQDLMKIVSRVRKDAKSGFGCDMHYVIMRNPGVDIQILEAAVEIVMSEPRRRSRKE